MFASITAAFSAAKLAAIGLVLVLLVSSAWAAKHYYDQAHTLQAQVAFDARQLATAQRDAAEAEAALTASADAARARQAASDKIRRTIYATPSTSTCASSPAVVALLDGMRHPAAGGSPAGARRSPTVPGAAGSAAGPGH